MKTKKTKRQRHDYTSEFELKTLLIRLKNAREAQCTYRDTVGKNSVVSAYVKLYERLQAKNYSSEASGASDNPGCSKHLNSRKNEIKLKVKERCIQISERTIIDKKSYERFGEIILLMIEHILTKPQFSGYTYRDDFNSDAVYKILKYNHNFKHKMISKTTGTTVNAFAYISQIIHNSIIYVINQKKRENDIMKKVISLQEIQGTESKNLNMSNVKGVKGAKGNKETENRSTYTGEKDKSELKIYETEIYVAPKNWTLSGHLRGLKDSFLDSWDYIKIKYPSTYTISFEEYEEIKTLLRGKISVSKLDPKAKRKEQK